MVFVKSIVYLTNMESMNSQHSFTTPLRVDKTIAWLKDSRDQWKHKCLRTKLQLKRITLALKRARDGRLQLKKQLRSLGKQNQELESTIQAQQSQLSELKKKHSSKKMI